MTHRFRPILGEIDHVLSQVDEHQMDALCQVLLKARGIVVHGLGRGGLVMRGLAMRLMHLGLSVSIVGDMITPPIGPQDLFLVNCAGGRAATIEALVDIAHRAGAHVAMLTAQPQAPLPQRADLMLVLPAQTLADSEGSRSVQPMGSVYEQALWIFCDALVMQLLEALGQSGADMRRRHTNLE